MAHDAAEVAAALEKLERRISELETENARLRGLPWRTENADPKKS